MKKIIALAATASLFALGACNNTPREQAADNIEANAEATADNLEDMADNASSSTMGDAMENQADAVRNTGDMKAEDVRTNDPDTNLSNGM